MSSTNTQEQFRLGFLTAVEDAERGMVGGLLVTNKFGRPLEFQCTTPVKPNRTQQILYGHTLRPYLLSEVVGKTLIDKISVQPHLVLVESEELLSLREFISIPVACLESAETAAASADPLMKLGKQHLRFANSAEPDRDSIRKASGQVPDTADLLEPFDRIREALAETLKVAVARSA
ncbi:hypothetical protein GC163_01055 [bacterium]|nr:hypothetical protein [bacterium]